MPTNINTDIPCAICEKLYATSNQEIYILDDFPSLMLWTSAKCIQCIKI